MSCLKKHPITLVPESKILVFGPDLKHTVAYCGAPLVNAKPPAVNFDMVTGHATVTMTQGQMISEFPIKTDRKIERMELICNK